MLWNTNAVMEHQQVWLPNLDDISQRQLGTTRKWYKIGLCLQRQLDQRDVVYNLTNGAIFSDLKVSNDTERRAASLRQLSFLLISCWSLGKSRASVLSWRL